MIKNSQKIIKMINKNRNKKTIDFILSSIAMLLFIIVFAVVGPIIKLTSNGLIFHLDKRIGKSGKIIKIYKFRTMYSDKIIDKTKFKNSFKIKNDERITPIGKFLRKYSIDELPQIINILKGEMSFVGPRPILPEELKVYPKKDFEFYKTVNPGLTGLWQVSGRNNLSYKERVRLNTVYIKNQSLWLDIKILFKTIKVVLTGEGAY